jgi:hypothetical protein
MIPSVRDGADKSANAGGDMTDGKAPQQQRAQADAIDAGLAGAAIPEEALRKAETYIEEEEGAANRLVGYAATVVTAIAVVMSLFHLYTAIAGVPPLFTELPIIATQPLRYTHVAFVMVLCFLLFPLSKRFRNRIQWFDVIAAAVAVGILIYAIDGGEDFTDRATVPNRTDVVLAPSSSCCYSKPPAAPSAGSCRRCRSPSLPMRWRDRICRRHGRIAASASTSWSGICSSRSKASSVSRSMCRRH